MPTYTPPANRVASLALASAAGVLACAALLLLLTRPALAAPGAQLRSYPGAALCNGTLQACINGADNGDTIVIQPGTYITGITLSKPVSLTGVNSATTILQALSGQRVLTVNHVSVGPSVVISGLTFTGGDIDGGAACPANCGGGLLITANAEPSLVNLIVHGNSAWAGGGLFMPAGATLRMTGSLVLGNTSQVDGGGAFADGPAVLSGGRFFNNNCTFASCSGGALYAGGALTITGAHFISNTAGLAGGAIFAAAPAVFDSALFQLNRCTQAGCSSGGLYAQQTLALTNAQFISNRSSNNGGGARVEGIAAVSDGQFRNNTCSLALCQGGGLAAQSALHLTGTQFISNAAGAQGGGLFAAGPLKLSAAGFISNTAGTHGGGLYSESGATVNAGLFHANECTQAGCGGGGLAATGALTVIGTNFVSNTARLGGGGAAVLNAPVDLSAAVFQRNRCTQANCRGGGLYASQAFSADGAEFRHNTAAGSGGGLYHLDGDGFITNTLLAGNAAGVDGAALLLASSDFVTLKHVTIAAPGQVVRPAVHILSGTVAIINSLFASHNTGIAISAGTVYEDYNLFAGVPITISGAFNAGGHSITGTAGFANPALGDYHLTAASDAIDAGTAVGGVSPDFEGDPRPYGDGFDIGYDEWVAPVYRLFLALVRR